ncbi:MAG TPA: hypothetical protein VFB06_21945 [Streptosporangiaceae bacterium]|nr:hypothetical protein [Streptosporangiaceae bacterium]
MADPITTAIAAAIAGGMAQSLGDQARASLTALAQRIREKLGRHPAAKAALDAALDDPSSSARVGELAHAIAEACEKDPEFGTEVRALWGRVRPNAVARDDGVVNTFEGSAEKVVQLRDVHGDLRIS